MVFEDRVFGFQLFPLCKNMLDIQTGSDQHADSNSNQNLPPVFKN